MSSDLLTREQLEEITGAKQWSKIAKVLSDNGIYFILRADGEIRTTWHHVHNPSKQSTLIEPDFSKAS